MPAKMEKWLVVSNCHTLGLVNSISSLTSRIDASGVHHDTFAKDAARYNSEAASYDRILVHPAFVDLLNGAASSTSVKVSLIPSVSFRAYHPDFTYVHVDGRQLPGPTGPYHSMLALAASELGMKPDDSRALFRGDVYEACGYFQMWASERDAMVKSFASRAMDISASIRRWGRHDAFMYTFNHPKLRCIYDIARAFLHSIEIEVRESRIFPMDNLAQGPSCPVYPEIGEALGVPGSYFFKPGNSYRCVDLAEFVTASLDSYQKIPKDKIAVQTAAQGRYNHVKAVISGLKQ